MEGTICPGLFETIGGCIHRLSSGGEGTGGKYFDLLRVSDASASVNDFLSGFLEILREPSKLLDFSFDEGVTQLLHRAIDDKLVGLSRLEDPLAKRVEGSLGAITRSCAQLDREYGVSFTHGEMGAGTDVVEHEVHVFGLALVIICIANGCGDAKSPVGPVLDKWWSWMCVSRVVVDDIRVGTHYYDRGSRRLDAVCERWR